MDNLTKMKGREEYLNISITHDYSILERKLINEWVKRAKEKTSQSEEFTYKVWGNIKNGLYLKRFNKKKDNENHKEENKNNNCKSTS